MSRVVVKEDPKDPEMCASEVEDVSLDMVLEALGETFS